MNVQRLLEEWAKWVLCESEGRVNYPSRSAFDRMRGGGIPAALISLEDAENVSKAMSWLARHKPRLSDVVERYYIQRQNVSYIARERKEDRRSVSQSLFAGETAVEVYLMGHDEDNY